MALKKIAFGLMLGIAGGAYATDVNITGLFSEKAMVSINGGKPRMMSVGQTSPEGVKLIQADSAGATVEIDGKKQTLGLGQSISYGVSNSSKPSVTLTADTRGHFITTGTINGATVRFLIDTGASTIAISSQEARNLGISYVNGERAFSSTANGVVPVYRVILNNVKIGDISLNQVEAMVIEGNGLNIALLGMSFLKRLEMKREGTTLTLTKPY